MTEVADAGGISRSPRLSLSSRRFQSGVTLNFLAPLLNSKGQMDTTPLIRFDETNISELGKRGVTEPPRP